MHTPSFWAPLSPLHPYKEGGLTPKILKKKGVLKKKWDDDFSVFWKQQNAFCNFVFKMKRTFSKDPEHPKIPRPGILSDLFRNFTLISVWILSEFRSEFWSEFWSEICLNICLNFVWILLSEFYLNFRFFPIYRVLWIQTCLIFVWIVVWILSECLSEFCPNFVRILSEFCLNFYLHFVWVFCLNFGLNFDWILSELKQDTRKGREAKK